MPAHHRRGPAHPSVPSARASIPRDGGRPPTGSSPPRFSKETPVSSTPIPGPRRPRRLRRGWRSRWPRRSSRGRPGGPGGERRGRSTSSLPASFSDRPAPTDGLGRPRAARCEHLRLRQYGFRVRLDQFRRQVQESGLPTRLESSASCGASGDGRMISRARRSMSSLARRRGRHEVTVGPRRCGIDVKLCTGQSHHRPDTGAHAVSERKTTGSSVVGNARALGARDRGFESRLPDQTSPAAIGVAWRP